MKENNMLKSENDLIKGDIRIIGNSMDKIEGKNELKKNQLGLVTNVSLPEIK